MGLLKNDANEGFKNLVCYLRSNWKKLVVRITAGFLILSLSLVLVFRFVPIFITPLMVIRSVESVFSGKWIGIEKEWVPLEEISPAMQAAVLKTEDYKFFEHNGFDFEAIQKAYEYNKKHNRKKGASTVSQQTAKNVFLWPSRSWVRKGLEAYFTVLIETLWPKDRILEVYLNVIELGPGVYGVEAASQKYFKRSSRNLNRYQASLMAAVLPNPNRFRIDRPSAYVRNRQNRIMSRPAPPRAKKASL